MRGVIVVALLSACAYYLPGTLNPTLPYPAQRFGFAHIDPATLPLDNSPLEGVYARNEVLRKAHKLFDGVIASSETVAVSPEGNLTLVDKHGFVYEAEPATKVPGAVFTGEWALDLPATYYLGPGRPLGFHHDAAGNLVIADTLKGLIRLDRTTGAVELLTARVSADSALAPDTPLAYVNDLDIDHDTGVIYFTDSQSIPVYPDRETGTFYDTFQSYLLGFIGGDVAGRLCRYDPATLRTDVLLTGLWFANGVALAADKSYVAVVETNRLRVHRYWLSGPKAGTSDLLIERLPGFPDGMSRAPDGNMWLAIVAPVTGLPKLLKSKVTRFLLAYLPAWARPRIPRWGAALKISPTGQPLQLLMDPDGSHIAFVSSVTEVAGRLYFGNVRMNYVSYLDLKDV
ncbi:hypothetical protein CHLRE_12g549050v5 [Chlamydomonas reinhardtii]|uniref:Strictosidine synthase conserved region domain-containing protein n=1 Tax=Chlamydomonas reinhardtii TaxID=3055 RepID=A0A2K3D6B0_CHLRE|nr:uncharacterized protein CHLRE_12g549050v5 [Chlamydomonas reinhardtii]PNW76066.1 hypothetical protein CHLRE_12g549050v5 [Chlamydomonas reinhardtii]